MIVKGEYFGSPFLGMFVLASDDLALVPKNITEGLEREIRDVLFVETVKVSIYNSSMLGIFGAMNSRGIVLPEVAYSDEIKEISEYVDVTTISEYTAVGNLVSVNDRVALVSPVIGEESRGKIEDTLGVKVLPVRLAGIDVTGSLVAMTNRGFLASPLISDKEFDILSQSIGLEGAITTLNYGNPMVKSCLVANSNGAIVGELTTPFEMGKVDEALFLG